MNSIGQGGRLETLVTGTLQNLTYIYDKVGNILSITNSVAGETSYFVGGYYEFNDTTDEVTKYTFAGASKIAMRKYIVPQTTTLTYLLGDHIGSTSLAVDADTGDVVEMIT